MGKIFRNLWQEKASVIAIILLLIVQAYCDLALPSYTSDIVDVGIQRKGIAHAAPDKMREETMESLCLFLEEEQETEVRSAYDLSEGGIYQMNAYGKEQIEQLDEYLSIPIVLLSTANSPGMQGNPSTQNMQDIQNMQNMQNIQDMPKDALLAMKEEAMAQMEQASGGMADSMVSQMALQFVQQEYEAIGIDLNDYQMDYLLKTAGFMLMYAVVGMLAAIFVGLLAARCGARIGMRLREQVFGKVVSFSNNEINQFSTASLITRSTNDIQQVQMVSTMLLRMVLFAPIMGIGGIVKVVNTKTGLGWIITVGVIVIVGFIVLLMSIALPKFKVMQTLVDKLNLVSREILTGIPVIRAFSREKFEEERFAGANGELMKTQLFTNRVMTFMMPVMTLVMNGISVAIVWFGSKGVDVGNLQVGDMMAFITYSMMIVMAFLMLTMMSIMLPRAGVAAERIDEVIRSMSTILDPENPILLKKETAEGVLAFHDVSFRYPGADEDALEHISFTAEPGKTTAIIGSTGCGKSTLMHLISRFYDVTEGSITIDGTDIREVCQKDLRALTGLVPQKAVLFSGTIASNIKFADENTSDENMKQAAAIAQATEFIEEKKDTYDSAISQGGSNVSGGQKQRLSIARAIAKEPKIYLFDDSFSALDYKTDVALRKALTEKTGNATVIIVAQRISTILHADQIIVLDDGRIAGIGTHQELLDSCEAYQEIAGSQLSEAELKGGKGA